MEEKQEKYVLFDWAIKRIFRDKENFGALEGFLTELLEREVKIVDLLESESNQEDPDDKQNRVDLLARLSPGSELAFIEVQVNADVFIFQRALYGASRLVAQYIRKGEHYGNVKRVISVSILSFSPGIGDDYLYVGQTQYKGKRDQSRLELFDKSRETLQVEEVSELFPQYYFIILPNYRGQLETPLDHWIYFLRNSDMPPNPEAAGLAEAGETLSLARMTPEERQVYERFADEQRKLAGRQENKEFAAYEEMLFENWKIATRTALEEETVRQLLAEGVPVETVARAMKLGEHEIRRIGRS